MNLGFDILRVDESGPLWLETVQDFATAKARIAVLMKESRCGYIIYSAETVERFLVKASNGDGRADGNGGIDGKQKHQSSAERAPQ